MLLDSMRCISSGALVKIKEPTVLEAKKNIIVQKKRKYSKPYSVPADSLMKQNNQREN